MGAAAAIVVTVPAAGVVAGATPADEPPPPSPVQAPVMVITWGLVRPFGNRRLRERLRGSPVCYSDSPHCRAWLTPVLRTGQVAGQGEAPFPWMRVLQTNRCVIHRSSSRRDASEAAASSMAKLQDWIPPSGGGRQGVRVRGLLIECLAPRVAGGCLQVSHRSHRQCLACRVGRRCGTWVSSLGSTHGRLWVMQDEARPPTIRAPRLGLAPRRLDSQVQPSASVVPYSPLRIDVSRDHLRFRPSFDNSPRLSYGLGPYPAVGQPAIVGAEVGYRRDGRAFESRAMILCRHIW